MTIEITYTREQVIELLACNDKARRSWIIRKLEERYNTVETVGRGKNIIFICKVDDYKLSTPEGAYNAFKNILIEDYGFKVGFNYYAILKLIEFHINNDKPISNKEISENIGISERVIYNYRKKLKQDILKDAKDCKKVTIGRNIETLLDEDITNFYNEVIIPAFNKQLRQIQNSYFDRINTEIAIFTNLEANSYEIIAIEEHNFDFIKKTMLKVGNNYVGTYPVIHKKGNLVYINKHLKNKLWELIIKGYGYTFIYNLRIYEIHENLKKDKELLDFIKLAIQYNNEHENINYS